MPTQTEMSPRAAWLLILAASAILMITMGFLCNLLVRPVADKYFMTDAQLAAEQALGHDKGAPALAANGLA